jgi:hypothetical protein
MDIVVHVEGDKKLTGGFSSFFSELHKAARKTGGRLRVIPGCGREQTMRDFRRPLPLRGETWRVLLIDSERELEPTQQGDPEFWVEPNRTFWMVQCLEAWFLADKDALESFYGTGFRRKALPPNERVENIPKDDVSSSLVAATRDTSKGT